MDISKTLKLIDGQHKNLLTTQSLHSGMFIEGIYIQGICNHIGKVSSHKHDDLYEMITITEGSNYAGLDNEKIISVSDTRIIPLGITHGSDNEPSFGQWLSIKVKNHVAFYDGSDDYGQGYQKHNFNTPHGKLGIVLGKNISVLEKIVGKPELLLGLPIITELAEGAGYVAFAEYEFSRMNPSLRRYVAISLR